jgi:hypothetical protein
MKNAARPFPIPHRLGTALFACAMLAMNGVKWDAIQIFEETQPKKLLIEFAYAPFGWSISVPSSQTPNLHSNRNVSRTPTIPSTHGEL